MTGLLAPSPDLSELVESGADRFLVLDFDGVINAFDVNTAPANKYDPLGRFKHHLGRPDPDNPRKEEAYWINFSQELVDALSEIAKDKNVQPIWLTTWRENIGPVLPKLGFTSARESFFIPWVEYNFFTNNGKHVGFRNFFAKAHEDHPEVKAAWVDDQVLDNRLFEASRDIPDTFNSDKLLIVQPDPSYGISRRQMDSIRNHLG